jgi:hypothetical protein
MKEKTFPLQYANRFRILRGKRYCTQYDSTVAQQLLNTMLSRKTLNIITITGTEYSNISCAGTGGSASRAFPV